MKYFVLLFALCEILNTCYSQNCKDSFKGDLEKVYKIKRTKFNRIATRSVESEDISRLSSTGNIKILNLPVVEGEVRHGLEINEENFFCHLNTKRLKFDEAIILDNNQVLGFVIQCPSENCNVKFIDKNQSFYIFLKPLAEELSKINPDIIFSISHISDAYWYIKDDIFNVITFENRNGRIENLRTYNVEDYIHSLSEDQIKAFLYFKRAKILTY